MCENPSLPPSGPKVFVQQTSEHFETITLEEALAQSKGKGLGLLQIPDMTPPGWEEFVGIAASDMQTMNAMTELAHRLQHSGEVREKKRQARKKERRRHRKLAADTRFTTDWPFAMKADLAGRKVRRGDKEADLGGNRPAWETLVKLANNYPSRTLAVAMQREETELGAVYAAVSKLRRLLAPLGITILNPGRRGYLLAEVPPKP
jgi:hypothetical protein